MGNKDVRRLAYENTQNMVNRAIYLLRLMVWDETMVDCFKSVTIKFIQMQLCFSKLPVLYTKKELIQAGAQFFSQSALEFLLYRGRLGKFDEVSKTLNEFAAALLAASAA